MRNLRIEIAQVPDEQGSNETCPDASERATDKGREGKGDENDMTDDPFMLPTRTKEGGEERRGEERRAEPR